MNQYFQQDFSDKWDIGNESGSSRQADIWSAWPYMPNVPNDFQNFSISDAYPPQNAPVNQSIAVNCEGEFLYNIT